MTKPGYGKMSKRLQGTMFVPPEAASPAQVRLDPANFTQGVRLDASALEIPLAAAVAMDRLRFEETGVRRDFGFRAVGGTGDSSILAIAEHKFVFDDEVFHRLARFRRNEDGNAVVEVWDGTSWIEVDVSVETIRDVYLSAVSTQGQLCIADGTHIICWTDTPITSEVEHDWPAGNELDTAPELTGGGGDDPFLELIFDSTFLTVSPGEALFDEYTAHYEVEVTHQSGTETRLVVEVIHENTKVSRTYKNSDPGTTKTWEHEDVILIDDDVEDGDTFELRAAEFETEADDIVEDDVQVIEPASDGRGRKEFRIDKSIAAEAVDETYVYHYSISTNTGGDDWSITVAFYYRLSGADPWTFIGRLTFDEAIGFGLFTFQFTLEASGLDEFSQFSFVIETPRENPDGIGFVDATLEKVTYEAGGGSFRVHGFNKESNLDPHAGLTYFIEETDVSVFEEPEGAPNARYIFAFADRMLALQDEGDPQKLSWSVDGDVLDWDGEGSGSTSLLDARSDPIDDLQAIASVASNVAALFRKRSIMKVFETGNVLLAIGVEHWIEGLGTESPFSVEQVKDGVMFLGHDRMVYYWSGQGSPTPVGQPIHQYLIENLTMGLDQVDATYDPVFHDYYLGIPIKGSGHISEVWIFDVNTFLMTGGELTRWRTRELDIQRFATASQV